MLTLVDKVVVVGVDTVELEEVDVELLIVKLDGVDVELLTVVDRVDTLELDKLEEVLLDTLELTDVDEDVVGVDTLEVDEELDEELTRNNHLSRPLRLLCFVY